MNEAEVIDDLLAEERAKYEQVYTNPHYRKNNQGLLLWQNWRGLFPSNLNQIRSFLDIGCGDGRLFAFLAAAGVYAWGVDFVDVLDEKAKPYRHRFIHANLWDDQFLETYVEVTNADSEKTEYARAQLLHFELGICADVMEHIPPEKVDDVLANICPLCDRIVFEIANYPSAFGDLHLSLHDAQWWLEKLSEHGRAVLLQYKRQGVNEYLIDFYNDEV